VILQHVGQRPWKWALRGEYRYNQREAPSLSRGTLL
jgi:hypothetical protein